MNFNNENGTISALVVALSLGMLCMVTFGGFFVNGIMTAQKLNNAADRIALGAATKLISNLDEVCEIAFDLALSNKVILHSCELKNDSVVIRVISDEAIQPWLDRWPKIGMARAGIDYALG